MSRKTNKLPVVKVPLEDGDINGFTLQRPHSQQVLLSVYDDAHLSTPLIVGRLNRREVCRLSSALAELAIHMRNAS